MTRNIFRLDDGRLDKQYLRVCATYKLLKLCRIDADVAVELLEQRRISGADRTVSLWVGHLENNEWHSSRPRTIMGDQYGGPRPG